MDSEGDYSTNEQVEESEQDSIEIQRDNLDLKGRLEALLFVSPFPTPVSQFAAVLDASTRMVERAVDELQDDYISHHRGIRIQKHAGKIQLISAPEASSEIQAFLNLESTTRLTTAALEVLSIVAYLGPVTRPQIDAIRGVNSDSVLRTILRFGLVEETGRSEGPGRPFLYAVTTEFLQNFGLSSVEDLPPLGVQMEMESES